MPAQMPDRVKFRGQSYALVAAEGEGLFVPEQMGLKLDRGKPISSCWNSYHARYIVRERPVSPCRPQVRPALLHLQSLWLRVKSTRGLPDHLYGAPLKENEWYQTEIARAFLDFIRHDFNYCYLHSPEPVRFTGRLTLGMEFDRRLRRKVGFPPPWTYGRVVELEVDRGVVTGIFDRSRHYAGVREAEIARLGSEVFRVDVRQGRLDEWGEG